MASNIGLVACSARKLDRPAEARELYSPSQLFRAASAYAAEHYDRWYILSAEHGVLTPSAIIEPYNISLYGLSRVGREIWATTVLRQLGAVVAEGDALHVHAGEAYRAWVPYWGRGPVAAPLAGLRIGEQLRWYKERTRQP